MNNNKKILWIDLDGTMNAFIDPLENRVIINDWTIPGRFINKKPIYIVFKAILQILNPKEYEYHILSQAPNGQSILEKDDWLDNYFPVPYKNRHYIEFPHNNDKSGFIYNYCKDKNIPIENCTILEDTHKHLFDCEAIGMRALHISALISMYEDSLDKEYKKEILDLVKKKVK